MFSFLLALGAAGLAAARGGPTVGVLLKGDTEFWSAVEAGCREAARSAGAAVVVRKPKLESDIAGQIRLLAEFTPATTSALIIAPCSSTELSAPVAKLAAQGVKIVVIDSPLDVDMPAYIATNHTNAGEAAGRLLGALVGPGDEVSILRHTRTGGATLLRESSAYAAIYGAHPGIVVHRDLYGGEVPGQEVQRAKALLEKYPRTKAVLCSSTPVTMGMLQALQETGKAGAIKFVGFGFNLSPVVADAIDRGVLSGWIAQLPNDIGRKGMNAALALLHHKPVSEVVYCDFRVITKANLHTPETQGLLPRNQ